MAARSMRWATCLGLSAGFVNFLICVPLALAATALFTPQQLGGSAPASMTFAASYLAHACNNGLLLCLPLLFPALA